MPTIQGDVALLNDPVAQKMLQSTIPARYAYNWRDGTPRVVPIGFHWNGSEIVLGTPPDAPKMKVLKDGDQVALTIDSDTMPHNVLLIRGIIRTDTVDGIALEVPRPCLNGCLVREGDEAWLDQLSPDLSPHVTRLYHANVGGYPGLRDPLSERTATRHGRCMRVD